MQSKGGKPKSSWRYFERNVDTCKTQFESVHMSEAHTRWRQEFKGVNFFHSNICYDVS